MKLYAVTIRPMSGFGTALKGDTLFGHLCWQAAYDDSLLNGGLKIWIDAYEDRPFAVLSSGWPQIADNPVRYAVKRPDLPLSMLYPRQEDEMRKDAFIRRKENRNRKWLLIGEDLCPDLKTAEYVSDQELGDRISFFSRKAGQYKTDRANTECFISDVLITHNSVSRLSMTTADENFAPFPTRVHFYPPGAKLVVFALIDSAATDIERIAKALGRIGATGYGRDASSGRGRFEVLKNHRELSIPSRGKANAFLALSPSVPEKTKYKGWYFAPFVRWGKHGDRLALSRNPFKNPVIMADDGAVYLPRERSVFDQPFLGCGVKNPSRVMDETVAQGYAFFLPFNMEIQNGG